MPTWIRKIRGKTGFSGHVKALMQCLRCVSKITSLTSWIGFELIFACKGGFGIFQNTKQEITVPEVLNILTLNCLMNNCNFCLFGHSFIHF